MCMSFFFNEIPRSSVVITLCCLLICFMRERAKNLPLKLSALPEGGRFLQDSSHHVHLAAAVAESPKEIQIVREEAAL